MSTPISTNFHKKRLRLADFLIRFCLDHQIDNEFLMVLIFKIYNLLMKEAYVLEHKESRHHYIPRFLLRKFSVPNTNSKFVVEYSHSKEPAETSIVSVAFVPNLYSFKDKSTKSQSDFIENQLFAHALEKYASRIINRITAEQGGGLTSLEESILSSFVAFQYVRTPMFLFMLRKVLEYLHLEKKVPIEEFLKRDFFKDAFFENRYNLVPKDVLKFSIESKIKMDGADDLLLRTALSIGNELSSIIYRKRLRVLDCVAPAFFYLSDNPAGIYSVSNDRTVGPFLWHFNDDCLVYMPISPTKSLYYVHHKNVTSPGVIGGLIQIAITKSIFEFAFSDRKDDGIQALFPKIAVSKIPSMQRPTD